MNDLATKATKTKQATTTQARPEITLKTAELTVSSIADKITQEIYAFLKANTSATVAVKSTAIRDYIRDNVDSKVVLRRQIRDKVRYLCELGLASETLTYNHKQRVFLYQVK